MGYRPKVQAPNTPGPVCRSFVLVYEIETDEKDKYIQGKNRIEIFRLEQLDAILFVDSP